MIPRFYIQGTAVCDEFGEFEGVCVGFEWFGLLIEITFARRDRVV